jgi:hypothetical protein
VSALKITVGTGGFQDGGGGAVVKEWWYDGGAEGCRLGQAVSRGQVECGRRSRIGVVSSAKVLGLLVVLVQLLAHQFLAVTKPRNIPRVGFIGSPCIARRPPLRCHSATRRSMDISQVTRRYYTVRTAPIPSAPHGMLIFTSRPREHGLAQPAASMPHQPGRAFFSCAIGPKRP